MHAMKYLLGVVFFFSVYLLGKLMAEESRKWALALASRFPSHGLLRQFFICCGRIFQVVAVVWGFLDAVSALVLLT